MASLKIKAYTKDYDWGSRLKVGVYDWALTFSHDIIYSRVGNKRPTGPFVKQDPGYIGKSSFCDASKWVHLEINSGQY